MKYDMTLSNECEDLLDDDYDALHDTIKPTSPVEDEMRRRYLVIAKKKGLVRRFYKKEPMTLIA